MALPGTTQYSEGEVYPDTMADNALYELRERVDKTDGVVTFRATVTSTGEEVFLHELPAGTAELYDLARKHFYSSSIDKPVLDVFTFEGTSYVVTRPQRSTIPIRPWLAALGVDFSESPSLLRLTRTPTDSIATVNEDPTQSPGANASSITNPPAIPRVVRQDTEPIAGRSRSEIGHQTIRFRRDQSVPVTSAEPISSLPSRDEPVLPVHSPTGLSWNRPEDPDPRSFDDIFNPDVEVPPETVQPAATEGSFPPSEPAESLRPTPERASEPDPQGAFGEATRIFESPQQKCPGLASNKTLGEYTERYDRRQR
jgi:hypothetical protein